jgi:uncharacterized protein (TIGR02271 family)
MTSTVVGLLDRRSEAEEVVDDLVLEGFEAKDIHIVASDHDFAAEASAPGKERESGFHSLMVKLGFLEDQRKELGLPPEDADYYAEGVRRGGVLVTVDAMTSEAADRAAEILEEHGAVDIEERSQQWQQAGWTAPPLAPSETAERVRAGEETRIPVIQEELKVGKRAVERGGVRVYTHVSETPASGTVTLREEHIHVERHPVDRPVTLSDTEAFKEGVLELTETGEEVVASKQAQVVEEVVVSKGVTEHAETVKDTVRRTEVEVENLPPGQAGHPPKGTA